MRVDVVKHELLLEVISDPVLDSEYSLTQAAEFTPRPRGQRRTGKVHPKIPADAILGLVERFDYETDVGRFLEIKLPRVKSQNFSLAPPKMQLLQPKFTTVPLRTAPTEFEEAPEAVETAAITLL